MTIATSPQTRHFALDEVGDLGAEPGSRPWAIALRMRMGAALKDERSSAKQLRRWIDLLSEHKGYRALEDQAGVAFTSFEEFCRAPMPYGLGYDVDAITAVIDERKSAQTRAQSPKPLKSHGGDRRSDNQSHNVTLKSRGNSSDYLIAVLGRDHPDILKRLQAGEFKSARAAAIAAGIVKAGPVIPRDPQKLATAIIEHYSTDEARALVDAVSARFGINTVRALNQQVSTTQEISHDEESIDLAARNLVSLSWDILLDPMAVAQAIVDLGKEEANDVYLAIWPKGTGSPYASIEGIRGWVEGVGIGLYRVIEKGESVYGKEAAS